MEQSEQEKKTRYEKYKKCIDRATMKYYYKKRVEKDRDLAQKYLDRLNIQIKLK